ncbi:MAG: arginine--tRNA ligase, partial [Patescibacteria group bacterium]
GVTNFVVERPRDLSRGDYATNAALVNKLDPHELAGRLSIDGVEKIEVVGKFINFYLSREALVPQKTAVPQTYAGKKILAEYTDPNPFKEFHIGHLMSNAVGEAIARVLEAVGATVMRANYQGDIGPHVAKAVWGKMQKPDASWGDAYVYGAAQYDAHKEEIDTINKKIYERSDAQINALYDEGRKESLERFEGIYKILGTKFDHYFFESESGPIGLDLVKKHPALFEESEGAIVYRGAHTRVFITQKGLPTYEAKELGLAKLKQERASSDLYLTVTANEQNGFFEVVFDAIQKVFPALTGTLVHRSHGMMRFAQGKMSSRTGNVVTGESLLMDLVAASKEKMRGRELKNAEKTAEMVAVGAIKYAVLKQASGKDIVFDPEKSL